MGWRKDLKEGLPYTDMEGRVIAHGVIIRIQSMILGALVVWQFIR